MVKRRRKGKKKKGSAIARFFLYAFLLAFVAAGAAGCAIGWWVLIPYGPTAETFVNIPSGTSAIAMGSQLESAGIIRSQYAFYLLRRFRKGTLRAGTYRFDHPAPLTEVYNRIAQGDVYTISLTVPEGANIFDIAARAEQLHLGTREDFLTAAEDPTVVRDLIGDLDTNAVSLEGYLFPATYRFAPTATAQQMIAAMVQRFRAAAAQLGINQNLHHTVTIASLIERETAVDSERPLVASVFENRLDKRMPLMTDPAVIYGLEREGVWRGTIYASDLKRDTPYNTYVHSGLPPGPIANPGIPSLRAAMRPAQSNYLYFVAAGGDPQGHSVFSETLEGHTRNVAGYRKAVKRAGKR
jgi:UPF0755 protein